MPDNKIHVARDPHPASPAVQAKAAEMAAIARNDTLLLKKRRSKDDLKIETKPQRLSEAQVTRAVEVLWPTLRMVTSYGTHSRFCNKRETRSLVRAALKAALQERPNND